MSIDKVQTLLQQKADLQARLNLLPYNGTVEVKSRKGKKYLYIRKRINGKLTSTYVDVFTDELYQTLLRTTKEVRELNKQIRKIDRDLAEQGYRESELTPKVILNLDFARANMKANIYDQAVLEGVGTTYPQTEEIIDNGKVTGMTAEDVQKILNLKHAWEFILDNDIIQVESGYQILCKIASLVIEGFYSDGGRIRSVPVRIGGTDYLPPIPIETVVIENLERIVNSKKTIIDKAIDLCLYIMKTQVFIDGNKRTAVIFANHYLVGHGKGILVIPEKNVPEFKRLLVDYYEGKDTKQIREFLKNKCWSKMD